ncbi:MAG: hypothetical protein JO164_10765 [Candidatus Eremiobacteraeota bacterium]|nr:hypothetical protein [Candidatus Eremiobacteraeota bacterium]
MIGRRYLCFRQIGLRGLAASIAGLHDAIAVMLGRRYGNITSDARQNTRVYRLDTDVGAIDPSNGRVLASLNVGSPALRDQTTVPDQRRRAHIRWRTCAGLPSRAGIRFLIRHLTAAAPDTAALDTVLFIAAKMRHAGISLKPGASRQERPACRSA